MYVCIPTQQTQACLQNKANASFVSNVNRRIVQYFGRRCACACWFLSIKPPFSFFFSPLPYFPCPVSLLNAYTCNLAHGLVPVVSFTI